MTTATDLATAVLAWVRHNVQNAPVLCLVCHFGRADVTVTLCTARSGLISVIDAVTAVPPANLDLRVCDSRAHNGRGAQVLRSASRQERHRTAPVLDDDSVTAGELLDSFAPYGDLATATTAQLLNRHPDLDSHQLGYVLVGEVAGFPLLATSLTDSLQRIGRLLAADTGSPADILKQGADLITRGEVRFPEAYPHGVALRTWEIRNGRLTNGRVLLAPANSLRSGGAPVFGDGARHPTVVTVEGSGGAVELELVTGGDEPGALLHPRLDQPEPGRYAVSLRLVDGIAELVFRPEGSGAPAIRTVGPLPAEGV